MRWWLVIILFLTSCVTINNEVPNAQGVYNYAENVYRLDLNIAKAIQKQYAPNATVYIEYDQPLTYGITGLANKLDDHTYLIQLTMNNPDPLNTLFHEFGHIIDSENGRLSFAPHAWDGVPCNFKQPWSERPWEQSANMWRDSLNNVYENGQLEGYDYTTERFLRALKILKTTIKFNPFNSPVKDTICN